MRKQLQVGLTALAVLLAGCGRNESKTELRWRFVGGDTLQAQTNAPVLREVLRLPEAAAVAGPLATNLAAVWWRLGGGAGEIPAAAVGDGTTLMRELLSRLSIGEVIRSPDGNREFAVAINGLGDQAGAWEKAWPAWIKSIRAARGGQGGPPAVVRRDSWLLAVSDAELLPPDRTLTRLAAYPAVPTAVLQFDAGFSDLPHGHFVFAASNGAVRLTGKLTTDQALPKVLPPWDVPSMIRGPMVLFTAVRGLDQLLAGVPGLHSLAGELAPGGLFIWGQPGLSVHTYATAPVMNPGAVLIRLHEQLQPFFAPASDTPRFQGTLVLEKEPLKLAVVGGVPMQPELLAVQENGRNHLAFGVFPVTKSTNAIPPEILNQLGQTNLLYYGWETTAEGVPHWHVLGQLFDLLEGRHAIVTTPATQWMLAAAPKMGETVTVALVTGEHELTLRRKSPTGLSSLELAALARWLDPVPHFRRSKLSGAAPPPVAPAKPTPR